MRTVTRDAGGVPVGARDSLRAPSKPLVLTPHGVPDDIEDDIDRLLHEQRRMRVHPRGREPAEVRHEEDHKAADALPDAKPGAVDREQRAKPLNKICGEGRHNILMV